MRGLNECIVRLEPDNMRRISASMQVRYSQLLLYSADNHSIFMFSNTKWCHFQISHYNSAQDDFGTDLAIGTRSGLEPGKLVYYLLDTSFSDSHVLRCFATFV